MIWDIQTHDTLASTQARLKELAFGGSREGTGVQAYTQTGGYGRQGRAWVSPPGNLYLSLLLRPDCKPHDIPQMALVTGVAVIESIRAYVPSVFLKWPNDVLASDGRKLAGILLETDIDAAGRLNWLALGVGVNIASAPDQIGAALADLTEKHLSLNDFRDEFLKRLSLWYRRWQTEGAAPVRAAWLYSAHPQGTPLKIKLGESRLDGYFEGLDETGNLLLRLESGEIRMIASGEVHFGMNE
ncbi:MAG: biotin--[acetyl-CoA-carboxylase] ligase [Alphaproteobacteria bacterium]|nr:biotin--[acetyl-CoA-carboxylase] ligase [Alphaproteobacteria bacterium]